MARAGSLTMSPMGSEIAVMMTARRPRERIPLLWGEGILGIRIVWVRASEWHYGIPWCARRIWHVLRIGHLALGISARRTRLGNVRPLRCRMAARGGIPRRGGVVVVSVQTVRVRGLRPWGPPWPSMSALQRVSAVRTVAARRILDSYATARGFATGRMR